LSPLARILAILGSLCCFSALGQAQTTQFSAVNKGAGTWVPVLEVTSELTVTTTTSETCHQVLVSEREKAIEAESKKNMVMRWLTPSDPAAKSVKPGEYLENQRFLIETVCAPASQAQYHQAPYFATYLYKGEIRKAAFKYYPQDKILVLNDGTVVDAIIEVTP